MLVQDIGMKIKSQLGVTAVDTSADTLSVGGLTVELNCISGNMWYRVGATAVANTTATKLPAGSGEKLRVPTGSYISIISDASGATYQYTAWDI